MDIPLNRTVELLRLHAVEAREIAIEHHRRLADGEDAREDGLSALDRVHLPRE